MAGCENPTNKTCGPHRARTVLEAAHGSAATVLRSVQSGVARAAALSQALVDLLFPATCIACGAERNVSDYGRPIVPLCDECLDQMELLAAPMCRRCAAPLPNRGANHSPGRDEPVQKAGCFRCRRHKLWVDETIAAGLYEGRLRELLLRMKPAEGDVISLAVGHLIWQQCGQRLSAIAPQIVVPIPLHWRRRLARRTNSAALLAEILAGRLRAPLATGLLRRRRHTLRQSGLSAPKRWDNVRHAFSARRGYHLRNAHVLLVDDILTTGATCSEAARTLRAAGAGRVSAVVAARALTD